MIYVFDTSSIIFGHNEPCFVNIFHNISNNIGNKIENHEIYIPKRVVAEIQEIDDDVNVWTQIHIQKQLPVSEDFDQYLENITAMLMRKHPFVITGINGADYSIIAAAQLLDGIVVKEERAEHNPNAPISNIRQICAKEATACISLSDMARQYEW